MNKIEEYKKLVEESLSGRNKEIKTSNGTIESLILTYESFNKVLKEVDEDLIKLGNNFVTENNLDKEETILIQNTNFEMIKNYFNSLNIPGINLA